MKRKICFFIPEVTGGGTERVVCQLMSYFVKRGYDVSLMLLQDRIRAYEVDSAVNVILLPDGQNKIKQTITRIKFIHKYLKKNPDMVVCSFLFRTLVYMFFASLGTKNRWIVSERNNPLETPKGKLQRLVRDWAFCFADRCVFQTEDAKNYFPKPAGKKGIVIPNPIRDITPKRVPNDKHIITNICRFSPQKNLGLLIDVFEEVHKRHPEYSLKLYGTGSEEAKLRNIISAKKLDDCVSLEGFATDVGEAYREAEIFVSTSDYEGISNSMLEAMSVGVPSVCTDCPIGGARMMIDHGVNGMLAPVKDKGKLVACVEKLIEDRDFAESLAKNAIETCRKYDVETICKMWENEING